MSNQPDPKPMPALDISSKGNPEFAGRTCQHDNSRTGRPCEAFARYEVVAPQSGEAYIACGAHLAEYIRAVWILTGTSAIVKEIPGMWRPR